MNLVAIVIPIYKESLTITEQISLDQVTHILPQFPKYFMAPEKLRAFLSEKNYPAEYFSNNSMSSKLAYSKLLLEPEFYQRFKRYKYILLYQLDAFVFSNRLEYFCSLNYDYIGAPMPLLWCGISNRVGNGGLSLRNVESCIRVTSDKEKIYRSSGMKEAFEEAEDKFFAYCGGIKTIHFSVPPSKIASEFSIEFNVGHSWHHVSQNHLPFGCHAWSKSVNFNLWRPYIELFVSQKRMDTAEKEVLPSNKTNYMERKNYIKWCFPYKYIFKRILRAGNYIKVQHILAQIIPSNRKCILWGNGALRKTYGEIFEFAKVPVACIFDKKATGLSNVNKIPVVNPDYNLLKTKNFFVIIMTSKFSKDIVEDLQHIGLKPNLDFLEFQTIKNHLIDCYYGKLWNCVFKKSLNKTL